MFKYLAYLRCIFYYELGNAIVYLTAYDCVSDIAYNFYNELMHRSIILNDKYDLSVWKKP